MAKGFKLGLIQNRYTDWIVYDATNRCDGNTRPLIEDLIEIRITFSGPELNHNKTYIFDDSKKAKITAYGTFDGLDCTQYLNTKNLSLEVNKVQHNAEFKNIYPDTDAMVDALNVEFSSLEILFINNGDYISAETTTTGSNVYIKVIEGSLLDSIKWNIGVHRGNNFLWNTPNVLQKDLNFMISREDFGYETLEVPESYWNIHGKIVFSTEENNILDDFTEFSYKQTEIYRAKIFEYLANNFTEFNKIEQRWQTDMELFMQRNIYFDALYKSFLASIEIGNTDRAYELLNIIIDYKSLNPII